MCIPLSNTCSIYSVLIKSGNISTALMSRASLDKYSGKLYACPVVWPLSSLLFLLFSFDALAELDA